MTRIEMTIISSRRVKPRASREEAEGRRQMAVRVRRGDTRASPAASCRLPSAFCPLPVTIFLPVERLAPGLRAHVEDVGRAGGAALVRRVVVREGAPVALARDRVNGYL